MVQEIHIESSEEKFIAELAESFLSRGKGLSFRTTGKMIFAFSGPTRAKIDMMFLSKPLYLYFMNSDKEVIDVQKAEPWSWNPKTWKLYSPGQKYNYLLESFEELDIDIGDELEFRL